jgi:hypothetical protein
MARSSRNEDFDLDSLFDTIRQDDAFSTFRNIVKTARTYLKIEQYREEALALMMNRLSRQIHGKKQFSPKIMLEAAANDMSSRARLVEIRVRCKVHLDSLEDACKALKNHVLTTYMEEMRAFSNAESRNALIERVQKSARSITTEATALIDMLDQIVNDIDKASYHMSNMTQMIVMLDGSKGSKVI